MRNSKLCDILLILCATILSSRVAKAANKKVDFKVHCDNTTMMVKLKTSGDIKNIYLENLQHYPEPDCHPKKLKGHSTFKLPLDEMYWCGGMAILNTINGKRTFIYHIIVEKQDNSTEKLSAQCVVPGQKLKIHKRAVLPAGFQEQEFENLDIESVENKAPEPVLNVGVRQGDRRINGELNVNPGSQLTMEINLDPVSAPIYGLLVSYMQVSDTKNLEETIVYNGCSVDPFLFENFNTLDGDALNAKFRAFKFPDSNYVQFKGTVNVCLDKCRGVECSNNQIGYGRKRREIRKMMNDPNKVFEITLSTFIKIDQN
uniref:ZP domain-containing protein n=1 Tax=Cacopsylla melanoneura TaxID=428564 RepID=A0A8D8WY54_9HEMI